LAENESVPKKAQRKKKPAKDIKLSLRGVGFEDAVRALLKTKPLATSKNK
jgi:hypothetical protein